MDDLLPILKARLPACLSEVHAPDMDISLPDSQRRGPEFVTRQIFCPCGADRLLLRTAPTVRHEGLLWRRQVVGHRSPIAITCPDCGRHALLFDCRLHGWNGAQQATTNPDPVITAPYDREAGSVFVNYSYRNPRDYRELVAEGVPNPEDFFDTFSVYFRRSGSQRIQGVVSIECA